MPRKGHSEEQVIAALKQYESGDKVVDIISLKNFPRLVFDDVDDNYKGGLRRRNLWWCRRGELL